MATVEYLVIGGGGGGGGGTSASDGEGGGGGGGGHRTASGFSPQKSTNPLMNSRRSFLSFDFAEASALYEQQTSLGGLAGNEEQTTYRHLTHHPSRP